MCREWTFYVCVVWGNLYMSHISSYLQYWRTLSSPGKSELDVSNSDSFLKTAEVSSRMLWGEKACRRIGDGKNLLFCYNALFVTNLYTFCICLVGCLVAPICIYYLMIWLRNHIVSMSIIKWGLWVEKLKYIPDDIKK